MRANVEQPPEQVLNIALDFGSTDPGSLTKEQAIAKANPIIQALVSGDRGRQHAALRLIDLCLRNHLEKDSKYMMLGSVFRMWVAHASLVKAPKAERDKFVSAVNAVIELHGKEDPRLVTSGMVMFVDLSLLPLNDKDADSLLRRWMATDTYKQLTAP